MLETIAEGAGMTPGKTQRSQLSTGQLIAQAESSSQE
jgi:hypothetical protein